MTMTESTTTTGPLEDASAVPPHNLLPRRARDTAVVYDYDWRDWLFRVGFFVLGAAFMWLVKTITG